MKKLAIGIDLGGTNLKGVVLSATGEKIFSARIPTESEKGGQRILGNILRLTEILLDKVGSKDEVLGLGLGTPGFIDQRGIIIGGAENLPGWKGTDVFSPLKKKFGLKITGGNDVTVAALAESKLGAGKGLDNVICFVLGTGIGGGIVVNSSLYQGAMGMAGELGHIVVETGGIDCNCGQKGCVERYASGPGMVQLARNYAITMVQDSSLKKIIIDNSSQITSETIYVFVSKDDPLALKVHHKACEMLGRAVGIIINIFAPDRVVLGGGVMMAGPVITSAVTKYAAGYCFADMFKHCEIVQAELGEESGQLGAALLVFDQFASSQLRL